MSQVEGAYNFVLEHINLGIEINGLYRKEQYELPEAIIRELILNAVIHRNYMMSSCVQVAVYDDRVEISSPGSLFGTLTLEEALSGRSSIRNKVIAGVCEKLGIVEGWGTGLKRIMDMCRELNIRAPEFVEIGDLLRVNFYRPSYNDGIYTAESAEKELTVQNTPENCTVSALETEKLHSNCTVNIPEVALKTFSALKENPHATAKELTGALGISLRTVKNHLALLKQNGLIVRIGSDKSGYWEIVNNGN
ncbi:MAG: winged helix-turn-helix transcriptional regulator [Treponema sp.]|nr:winged helix-turn-helix transcriptional regulator [Treponema sp.]